MGSATGAVASGVVEQGAVCVAIDLTNFNVRAVPVTAGLQEQRKLSMDTTHSWWFDVLH